MTTDVERCPLCGSELSQTKYREIKAKLRDEKERKEADLAEAKAAITRAAEEEYDRKLEQTKRDVEKRARAEAQQQLKKLQSENQEMETKLKLADTREAEIRKQAQAEIERQKQTAERKGRADVEAELKKVTAERDETAAKLKESEARETAVRKEVEQKAEKVLQKELVAQRQALDKDKTSALLKQQAEHNRERESLQKKLSTVEHQLQKKTANELGDGGEIDVFEALRDAFSGDKITRIQKGQPGADILHEVLYKGESCGRIIIDSKNRQGWQYEYVTKLRQDQVEAAAEHAILATTAFPRGKKQLCIESGVIVISPAHIVHIVKLLRQAMVTLHVKGLSSSKRAGEMTRLYDFITSQTYRAKFTEVNKLTEDMLKVEEHEKTAHDNVWRKRGSLVKQMQYVLREIDTEVSAITESEEGTEQILPLVDENGVPSKPNG